MCCLNNHEQKIKQKTHCPYSNIPTSGSKKSNSGAQVYKDVSKFLKSVNFERKILVICAYRMEIKKSSVEHFNNTETLRFIIQPKRRFFTAVNHISLKLSENNEVSLYGDKSGSFALCWQISVPFLGFGTLTVSGSVGCRGYFDWRQ